MQGSVEERRFWMLMSECERLLEEEAFAIRTRNIEQLDSINARKESIISALLALESIIDRKRPDAADSQARLNQLQLAHENNSTGLGLLLNDLQIEKRQNARQKQQNKAVLNAYYGHTLHNYEKRGI